MMLVTQQKRKAGKLINLGQPNGQKWQLKIITPRLSFFPFVLTSPLLSISITIELTR